MELIHPASAGDVVEVLRDSSAAGTRVLAVGGRRHIDKGNPSEVDAELWTTQLDSIVDYEPAEMVAVVGAGIRVRDLDAALAEGGQEWPSDAPPDATVGGVIVAAANSPRRLRVGPVRDTVLEVELVTGDGRLVRGGGRTVKNVAGYDLPRLVAGSLGTLGVLVRVALKLRPLPKARRTMRCRGDGLEIGRALLDAVPMPAAVLATEGGMELRLEGWPEEVAEQTDAAAVALRELGVAAEVEDDAPFPASRPWLDRPVVVEAAVAPSRVPQLAGDAGDAWGTPLDTGLLWAGSASADGELSAFRKHVADAGGVAPVIRGPGGLGAAPMPVDDVQRRIKRAFDPAGVLAPGRFWGAI